MIMPSYSVLPESISPDANVIAGFGTRSLSGLGCDCSETDPETGDCLDPSPCTTTGPTTSGLTQCADGSYVSGACPPASTPLTNANALCPGGAGCVQCADGTWAGYGISCPTSKANPQGLTSTGLTQAQQTALASQIVKSGTQLATILALQPGQSVLANGSIISGATGVSSNLSSVFAGTSGTTMLMLIALGALLLFSRGR